MQTTQLTQLLHQRQLSFFRKFQNERPEYYISAGTELRGVLDNFWFHGNVCAVAQRAFVTSVAVSISRSITVSARPHALPSMSAGHFLFSISPIMTFLR